MASRKTYVYLNFNNLDKPTQEKIIQQSIIEVKKKWGEDIKQYAVQHQLDLDTLIEEEALKNLYNYSFQFSL